MQPEAPVPQNQEFLPATDPLWRNTPTPWTAHYAPLGIPLRVETNAPLLAEWAKEVFGHWDITPEHNDPEYEAAEHHVAVHNATEAIRLRLLLHDVAEVLSANAPQPLMRAQDSYFLLNIGQSLGLADRRAGFAVAYITPALMAHPDLVRSCYMECLGMYLACGRRRAPLHAAGVRWAGQGVLLTGRDGAGKSTLAYACLRAGFQLLAEDIVYAPLPQENEPLTLWGDSRLLHLLPDALKFFPELHSAPCIQQLSGETKRRVHVGVLRPDAPLTRMPVWGVCSLGRSRDTGARLLSSDPNALRRALTNFKGDPPLDAAVQRAAAERLLAGPTAHLEVGSDLDLAVTVLKNWMEQGEKEDEKEG